MSEHAQKKFTNVKFLNHLKTNEYKQLLSAPMFLFENFKGALFNCEDILIAEAVCMAHENGVGVSRCSISQSYIDLNAYNSISQEVQADYIFLPSDGPRNQEVERKILFTLDVCALRSSNFKIIYRTIRAAMCQITLAFVIKENHALLKEMEASSIFQILRFSDCLISAALTYCLSPPHPDSFSEDLLMRSACQLLVQEVAEQATGESDASLYHLCCNIAAAQYEGKSVIGCFVFSTRDKAESKTSISLHRPVHLKHHVGVRKLMEMTSENFALMFDGNYFWGFSSLDDVFQFPHVIFHGRGVWSIRGHNELECLIAHGIPVSREYILQEQEFKHHLEKCFPGITPKSAEEIWRVSVISARQSIGTNILFTPEAKSEALRLSSQCIPITPVKMTPDLVLQLTAIDGTVIMDIDGNVHALGAILDGQSTSNGTWQRGGRYNSAANYVSSVQFPALIFIVSQDGYVDIVPPIGPREQKWTQRCYLKLSSTVT